jgi:hypothetical protein
MAQAGRGAPLAGIQMEPCLDALRATGRAPEALGRVGGLMKPAPKGRRPCGIANTATVRFQRATKIKRAHRKDPMGPQRAATSKLTGRTGLLVKIA